MDDPAPVTQWLQKHRAGDAAAAQRLFEHFAQRLSRLAQRHLSPRVRQRVDGDDVVQSVFRSFFVRDAAGQFQIENSLELWKLLVTITLRKARKTWREHTAERRDVAREQAAEGDWLVSELCREPTVVEALILVDEIHSLVGDLSDTHARALELRLAGYTPTEIAKSMGISRQAVYRLLKVLQDRLNESDKALQTG
jgi:RNA polymerase sigma factor (sigma-70 family)